MQKQIPVAVGLDVGTSMVRCVVGTLNDDQNHPTVIGAGSAINKGMRKGTVINVEQVATAIHQAAAEAERISGQSIAAATISVNGAHIKGLNSKGVVAISSASREITYDDIARVEEAATVVQLPANREILQVFSRSFSLDGQDNIKDPIGMHGVRLEVDAHIVTAATPVVKNLERTLEVGGFRVNHRILAGLASAEASLEPKQRESGTVVIDFGAGTTNIIIFEEDEVQHVAVLPVGSINLTNDLAIGLRTDLDVAEEVKIKHARAHAADKKQGKIEIPNDHGDSHVFLKSDVDEIVEARLGELFELVEAELRSAGKSRKLPGGVVLVGGGSQLPGLDLFAREALQLPARVARPKDYSGVIDTTNNPAWAGAVGLMMLDLSMATAGVPRGGDSGLPGGRWLDSAKGLLGRFKP